jgi:hypothetical protein
MQDRYFAPLLREGPRIKGHWDAAQPRLNRAQLEALLPLRPPPVRSTEALCPGVRPAHYGVCDSALLFPLVLPSGMVRLSAQDNPTALAFSFAGWKQ